jgi:triphosphatase
MGIEREIKLSLPFTHVEAARRLLNELAGHAGRARTLVNIYFDTPEGALAQARGALRLRHTPDGWVQTLKFGGGARNGLHSRQEWEMPVASEKLEFDTLLAHCDDAAAASAVRSVASRVEPLFRTDFVRTLWMLDWQNAAIEAALDIGEVSANVAGETRRAPICEIELELKSTPGGVGVECAEASCAVAGAALDALAAIVQQRVPGVVPDDVSKAERGYRLRRDR